MTRAKVYINDTLCGILTEDHEGYHFQYTVRVQSPTG